MAGPLQPQYSFFDLLLNRDRVCFVAWFRHGQQELAHCSGEFLPFIFVCVAEFEHLCQRAAVARSERAPCTREAGQDHAAIGPHWADP